MKILSLNCQHNYHPRLRKFLKRVLRSEKYDFLLLQEANKKVISYIKKHKKYSITLPTGNIKQALTCIVSRTSIFLQPETDFLHFPHTDESETAFKEYHVFGLTCKIAYVWWQEVVVWSMHLPSGFSSYVRKKYLEQSTQYIIKKYGEKMTILWWDFNFGFPGELSEAHKILAPHYTCISQHISPTLDSYYTENDSLLASKIATFLRTIGISIKLKTDHFFTNTQILKKYHTKIRVLPHRVSDHSPIELTLIAK